MPKVKFLGVQGEPFIEETSVDDVTLQKNGEPQDVTKNQLERLRAQDAHRFEEVDSKAKEG